MTWVLQGSGKPGLFIDIPKTASKSTARLFGSQYVAPKESYHHASVRHLLQGEHPVAPEDHFTFSIVRNPWDRMYSLWWWNRFVKARKHRCPNVPFDDWCLSYEFLHWQFPGIDSVVFNRLPQTLWITDTEGNLAVDKVYRFEEREECWADLDRRGYQRTQSTIHLNKVGRKPKDWRSRYTPEMIDAVARIFASDIEMFGYTFEP